MYVIPVLKGNPHFILSNLLLLICRLFFRRHYPVTTVTYCGIDPQERRWTQKTEDGHPLSAKYIIFYHHTIKKI